MPERHSSHSCTVPRLRGGLRTQRSAHFRGIVLPPSPADPHTARVQKIAFKPGLEKIAKLIRLLREGAGYAFATLRRVSILGNLGIAPRLVIAFVAVAVLACRRLLHRRAQCGSCCTANGRAANGDRGPSPVEILIHFVIPARVGDPSY